VLIFERFSGKPASPPPYGHVRLKGLIRAACGGRRPERDGGTTLKTVSQVVDFGGILSTMISSSRDVCYCFSTAT
jgi:hypothetical protein